MTLKKAPKELVAPEQVVQSLLALRDELWEKDQRGATDVGHIECLLKINSCLYGKYPSPAQVNNPPTP